MADIIVKSKIKDVIKDLSVASEVADKLNEKVVKMLLEGAERAKANGRRTLQARDL
jgi:histone H3/H4